MPASQGIGKINAMATVIFLSMMGAAAWGFDSTLHGLHANWTGKFGHFSHGYLVLGMSIWLAWKAWQKEPRSSGSPGWLALPLLAATVVATTTTQLVSFETGAQSLLPMLVLFSLAAAFGWSFARLFLWPIAFLYTALPIWWYFNTPLQELTTFVVNHLVELTGVPAFVQGNVFHLPAGNLEVAAGCSGLRFLDTAVALSLFQGLLFLHSWRDRLKLIAVACVLALLANWLRVYSLMVIAYASDMQNYLVRVEHLYYGWAIFLACMWPVFWYGARLEHRSDAPATTARPAARSQAFHPVTSLVAGIFAAALLVAPRLMVEKRQSEARHTSSVAALVDAKPESTSASILGDQSLVTNAEEERATFRVDGEPVWIYRAATLHSTELTVWPMNGLELIGRDWRSRASSLATKGEAQGVRFDQRIGELRDTAVVARFSTTIAGHRANAPLAQKLAMLRGLLDRRQDAVVWIAVSPCSPDCPAGAQRLQGWMSAHPELLLGN